MPYTADQIAAMIDHTVLKADTTGSTIDRFCDEAIDYGFASVCIAPVRVERVASRLAGTSVNTCTVIGFPLGSATSRVKLLEARDAIDHGADELDMVIDIGALKDNRDDTVRDEIALLVGACHPHAKLKVIIESALLSPDEIVRACTAAVDAGADFVKTSTGFGPGGATPEVVGLMADAVAGRARIKASTGINDLATLVDLADAGATRMGTSKGIAILAELAAHAG